MKYFLIAKGAFGKQVVRVEGEAIIQCRQGGADQGSCIGHPSRYHELLLIACQLM